MARLTAAVVGIGAGVCVALGAVFPWVTFKSSDAAVSLQYGGAVMFVSGVVAAIVGIWTLRQPRRSGWPFTTVVLFAFVVAHSSQEMVNVPGDRNAIFTIGSGLWITFAASLVGLATSIYLTYASARRERPVTSKPQQPAMR